MLQNVKVFAQLQQCQGKAIPLVFSENSCAKNINIVKRNVVLALGIVYINPFSITSF